ncbi:GTPase domain-containing protein|uniref:50S ribosome-binding GTPase n=1 Tax=Dendrosporobacter quercicolus TaxID=146817 RepID=A0A1G9LRM8_9FIRM|nr:GTPase domain-containing protein [Dendrosporobacter quercicolus]NSL46807.1 GTPase domain-containing protein [Dendrosporobacter quercicolus DSM 1736]SDL64598.1 50S ribosome-binding GTPase [Dendrosporobacter quercicolus]
MREFIIVGLPNSGKTLFTLNFAAYLGSKQVEVTFRTYDGLITCRHFSIDEAKRELCSSSLHKTRSLQSVVLKLAIGKTAINFKLTDTCGLTPQINHEEAIRKGMAQTIGFMRSADFILHIVDLSLLTKDYLNNTGSIDHHLYDYGVSRHNYLLLANKIDLPGARDNLSRLTAAFVQACIIPVSALHSHGFKEVKAYVSRNI